MLTLRTKHRATRGQHGTKRARVRASHTPVTNGATVITGRAIDQSTATIHRVFAA